MCLSLMVSKSSYILVLEQKLDLYHLFSINSHQTSMDFVHKTVKHKHITCSLFVMYSVALINMCKAILVLWENICGGNFMFNFE